MVGNWLLKWMIHYDLPFLELVENKCTFMNFSSIDQALMFVHLVRIIDFATALSINDFRWIKLSIIH